MNALNCIVSRPGRYSMYAKSAEFGNSLNIIIALALIFATLYKLTIDRPKTTLRSKKDNSLGSDPRATWTIYGVTYLKGCFRPSVFSHYNL